MTKFIEMKFKKSDDVDQTNIEKYRVAANITEYHNKINLNFKIHNQVIIACKNVKINMFKMDVRTFGQNYRNATLSTFHLTVSGNIIPSLKSIGLF